MRLCSAGLMFLRKTGAEPVCYGLGQMYWIGPSELMFFSIDVHWG
jgi:hypothetical protein